MQIKTWIGALMLVVIVAPILASGEVKATREEAKKAISAAEIARDEARSVEGEWRDVGELISEARVAFRDGAYAKAISIAQKAQTQGELGYLQAISQQNLQMSSYFKP